MHAYVTVSFSLIYLQLLMCMLMVVINEMNGG
jgi:hypothetical protein